jgi:hypothetical protein
MATKQRLTPEELIERLRELREQFDEVKALSFAERRDLRNKTKTSEAAIHASISAVGTSDKVAHALGRSADDLREIVYATTRWGAVEGELRSFLNGVSSANLVRRYQLSLIATQAYSITAQLARDPENEHLVSIVEEMKRLRKLERRRKPTVEAEPVVPGEPEEER